MNIALLNSVGNLAKLERISDPKEREEFAIKLRNNTSNAVIKAINMREQREVQQNGTAEVLSNIGVILYFLSGLLFVLGKFIVYRSAKYDLTTGVG
ncbi:hypothetical protein HWA77_23295 [Photobacterium damselae subsp. damselae]|uniref:Uncharacterized protein n=1 Tax=Photobacterium damselae subsp. damselae TaxID=85581 RepID=A0A850QWY7_PHODD|nr:hypothetical protein [Photobacterium damselae subsp. damselae]